MRCVSAGVSSAGHTEEVNAVENMVNIVIDGEELSVPSGTTVLETAKQLGKKIPQLCFLKDINEIGACRMCVVEVEGRRNLPASCVLPAEEGMVVRTNSPRVLNARRMNLELILSLHPQECLSCVRSQNCELQSMSQQFRVEQTPRIDTDRLPLDVSGPIQRDPNKCILCRRCVAVCEEVQSTSVLGALERGIDTHIGPAWSEALDNASCTYCGQCIQVCPVGALSERDDTARVWELLHGEDHVVVQVAPAIRTALGEEFNLPPGTNVEGRMVAALRQLGFDKVFDTNFTADLTVMEEGHELLAKVADKNLPLITSCSPGWVRFVEEYYPQLTRHLSSCKSPQQMFGALAKTYYAELAGLTAQQVKTVSIMPCTAKKYEADRPEMQASGQRDVDVVLTTRELAALLRQAGIDLARLEDEEFDAPMGASSGASVLFGRSGGVAQAAARTLSMAYPERVKVGADGSVMVDGKPLRVTVVSSLGEARRILEAVEAGTCDADFIEIMACPGGCINGGGQPTVFDQDERNERLHARRNVIETLDGEAAIAGSHENPAVQQLYAAFLGHPLSEKSHQLLHTHYREELEQPDSPESKAILSRSTAD